MGDTSPININGDPGGGDLITFNLSLKGLLALGEGDHRARAKIAFTLSERWLGGVVLDGSWGEVGQSHGREQNCG